jgi:Tol biopolymer transport system component
MGRCLVAAALFLSACNAHLGDPSSHVTGVDGGSGTPVDAPATTSDGIVQLGPWGTPAVVPGASTTANNEDDPTLSSDGLELYFANLVPMGSKDLYVMKRATTADPFGTPTALTAFNTAGTDEGPRLSYDDLTIYYGTDGEIYQATRATKTSAFGAPSKVPGVNTTAYEKWLAVCGDGSHFMVSRDSGSGNGGQDLYEGTLGGGAGTLNATLSSANAETSTFLSKDCLSVYFASNRGGNTQIYYSTRATIANAWTTPALAPAPFDTGTDNEDPGYTPDNKLFVFASNRAGNGTKDVYLSTR